MDDCLKLFFFLLFFFVAICFPVNIREIHGDEETQRRMLYDYRLELFKTRPDSTIKFRHDQRVFEATYVCLSPIRNVFLSWCMRIIPMDGCFL